MYHFLAYSIWEVQNMQMLFFICFVQKNQKEGNKQMIKILGLDLEFILLNIPISFESEISIGKKQQCCSPQPPEEPQPPETPEEPEPPENPEEPQPPFPPYPPFANRDS